MLTIVSVVLVLWLLLRLIFSDKHNDEGCLDNESQQYHVFTLKSAMEESTEAQCKFCQKKFKHCKNIRIL